MEFTPEDFEFDSYSMELSAAKQANAKLATLLASAPVMFLERDNYTDCYDHGFHWVGTQCSRRGTEKARLVCIEKLEGAE